MPGATGSRMFLNTHTYVSIEDFFAVLSLSGNDASVALAEGIAGSEHAFAELMNYKVTELGLKYSHFVNATGLPHKDHYMSAADIANLSFKLIKIFQNTTTISLKKTLFSIKFVSQTEMCCLMRL